MDKTPNPDSLTSFTLETANLRMQDCSSGLSNHSLVWRMLLALSANPSGAKPASTSFGYTSTCLFRISGSTLSSAGLNIRSACDCPVVPCNAPAPKASATLRVLLGEAGDLLGASFLRGVVLLAVDAQRGLVVLEDEAIAAQMLVPSPSVLPEIREVPPHGQVVQGQG